MYDIEHRESICAGLEYKSSHIMIQDLIRRGASRRTPVQKGAEFMQTRTSSNNLKCVILKILDPALLDFPDHSRPARLRRVMPDM